MSVTVVLLLYLVGLGLLSLELFVPGIIIGIIGFCLVMTSLIVAFTQHSSLLGGGLTGVAGAFGYGLAQLAFRRYSLHEAQTADAGYIAVEPGLDALQGKMGTVETPLRPVGTARIEGRPITVQTRGEPLETGALIQVLKVRGNAVIVARAEATA